MWSRRFCSVCKDPPGTIWEISRERKTKGLGTHGHERCSISLTAETFVGHITFFYWRVYSQYDSLMSLPHCLSSIVPTSG